MHLWACVSTLACMMLLFLANQTRRLTMYQSRKTCKSLVLLSRWQAHGNYLYKLCLVSSQPITSWASGMAGGHWLVVWQQSVRERASRWNKHQRTDPIHTHTCTHYYVVVTYSLEKTICSFFLSSSCMTACILVTSSITLGVLRIKSPLVYDLSDPISCMKQTHKHTHTKLNQLHRLGHI